MHRTTHPSTIVENRGKSAFPVTQNSKFLSTYAVEAPKQSKVTAAALKYTILINLQDTKQVGSIVSSSVCWQRTSSWDEV
jgi:hypothetical protein